MNTDTTITIIIFHRVYFDWKSFLELVYFNLKTYLHDARSFGVYWLLMHACVWENLSSVTGEMTFKIIFSCKTFTLMPPISTRNAFFFDGAKGPRLGGFRKVSHLQKGPGFRLPELLSIYLPWAFFTSFLTVFFVYWNVKNLLYT